MFPLRGVTPVGKTSKMEVFWGCGGTQGTPGAPLEAVLERVLIFGRFLGAFWEALGDPLPALGITGDPTLAIFLPRGRHFAAPGRHPRHHAEKTGILVGWRWQKVRFFQGAGSE